VLPEFCVGWTPLLALRLGREEMPMGRALRLALLLALALLFSATTALAQGVITQIKTPPLQDSDTFTIHISVHNTAPGGPGTPANPPWAGWAGAIMEMHLLDNTELDVDGFHATLPWRAVGPGGTVIPGPGPTSVLIANPLGPRSQNVQSAPASITFWHPEAQNSGIPIIGSVNQPLGTGFFHVKGSSPAGNSDVDATFRFWNIWHVLGGGPGSTLLRLNPSDRVWVHSNVPNITALHSAGQFASFFRFPPAPHPTPFDPNAHWLHISETVTFHLTGFDASAFYATKLNTATLGVEHVPEPASAALIGLGLLSLATSRTIRRRRLAA